MKDMYVIECPNCETSFLITKASLKKDNIINGMQYYYRDLDCPKCNYNFEIDENHPLFKRKWFEINK